MTKVSVIVPVYNAREYLSRCVESLRNQTYSTIEIILIDDGSSDGSSQLCDQLKNEDDRIIVVHQDNRGVSAARNCGLDVAGGEYITFCDADDYYEPDKIEVQLNSIIKNNVDVSIVGIQVDYSTGKSHTRFNSGKEYVWRAPDVEPIKYLLRDEMFPFSQYALLIKKDLCDQVRFWEGKRINEDKLFCYEILKRAQGISYLALSKYHYILNSNSATHTKFSDKYFDAIEIAKKMELDVSITFPGLKKYAEINTYKTLISTLKYLLKDREATVKLISERKEIVSEIKAEKFCFAKNELTLIRRMELKAMLSAPMLYSKAIRAYSVLSKKLRGGV